MSNGKPKLKPHRKKLIEKCIIDPFIRTQLDCGNNPYSGLVRLSFHDCGTFDATDTTGNKAGCHAWMTKKCDVVDQCEFMALENNGLQKWVRAVDAMYDDALLNGRHLKQYLTRADFWHLAAFRAIGKSSSFKVPLTYHAGRTDPDLPEPGPRFRERIPDADAWANMLKVAHRNGMDDIHAAALIGAHTIGSSHPQNLGYQGSWDPTPFVFDAGFYQSMLDLEWHFHQIHSTNSLTGLPVTEEQFSLGGANFDRSVMLFSDMGSHFDLTNDQTCNVDGDQVSTGTCPKQATPGELQSALRVWADNPDTFFAVFADAYETMSQWGCDDCYSVGEVDENVSCDSLYHHTCQAFYNTGTYYYAPGWRTPAPAPTPAPTQTPHKKYY